MGLRCGLARVECCRPSPFGSENKAVAGKKVSAADIGILICRCWRFYFWHAKCIYPRPPTIYPEKQSRGLVEIPRENPVLTGIVAYWGLSGGIGVIAG
jgi:hypothetical protein